MERFITVLRSIANLDPMIWGVILFFLFIGVVSICNSVAANARRAAEAAKKAAEATKKGAKRSFLEFKIFMGLIGIGIILYLYNVYLPNLGRFT